MGTPIAPTFANFFMHELEQRFFNTEHVCISRFLETNIYSIILLYYLVSDTRYAADHSKMIYLMSVSLKEYDFIYTFGNYSILSR